MSARTVSIQLKLNYPMIMFMVAILHALALTIKGLPEIAKTWTNKDLTTLNIKEIRTAGVKESHSKNSAYLSPTEKASLLTAKPKALNMSDLSLPASGALPKKLQRPGTRPDAFAEDSKAISAIRLKGNQIKGFAQNTSPSASSGGADPVAQVLGSSGVSVNLEVPEGVNPDELNKYELKFYGFQRRTAISYINSLISNLNKAARKYPDLEFLRNNQVITGRLTYDEKGNIKKIKMIKWSNDDRLQDYFVDVLKDMDTLHNPPEILWKASGEFSFYFTLELNG